MQPRAWTSGMDPLAGHSGVAADYRAEGDRTWAARIAEHGSLRVRHPRGTTCEAVLVNTAGGVVAGDRLSLALNLGDGARVTATSVAAEKVYRSEGATAHAEIAATLAGGARLAWLPGETILFAGARFRRSFKFDLGTDAVLLAAETTVFGRLASGENDMDGSLHESWEVRRDGRLVYADMARLEGRVGAVLDRPAVAAGGRSVATVLLVAADAATALDRVRAACESEVGDGLDGGASLRDGVLVARLVAARPERLRAAIAAVVEAIGIVPLPRSWA